MTREINVYPDRSSFWKIKKELNSQARLKESLVKQAQDFTGHTSSNPEVLLKAVKRQKQKEARIEARRKGAQFNMSGKKYLALQKKAEEILQDFPTRYSMGEEAVLKLRGSAFCRVDNRGYYSGKFRGNETHGFVSIDMRKIDLERIVNIEGVWTVPQSHGKAKWLFEAAYDVRWVEGYLIGRSHGSTKEGALALERAKRREGEKLSDYDFVGLQDIKRLGACNPGIKAFCRKHNLDPKMGYRIDFLKELNGEGTPYFNRLTK